MNRNRNRKRKRNKYKKLKTQYEIIYRDNKSLSNENYSYKILLDNYKQSNLEKSREIHRLMDLYNSSKVGAEHIVLYCQKPMENPFMYNLDDNYKQYSDKKILDHQKIELMNLLIEKNFVKITDNGINFTISMDVYKQN